MDFTSPLYLYDCNESATDLRWDENSHEYFKIKKATGHKSNIAFQRYNFVTEEEMLGIKWLDLKNDKHRTMDTYMDN